MGKKLALAFALAALIAIRAEAADSDLQQMADALDVATTKTFQFSASGSVYALGQSTSPLYDFTAGAMRDEVVRIAAEPPSLGAEQRSVTVVNGDYAWNLAGTEAVPRMFEAPERAHQIVISPHGLLRAAFASNAT